MRVNGVRSLEFQCHQCRRLREIVNVDHLPGDLTVPSLGPKMACTKCGIIDADARPNCSCSAADIINSPHFAVGVAEAVAVIRLCA